MNPVSGKVLATVFILMLTGALFLPVAVASDNETAEYQIVIGKLVCDANPCTTDPCVPGMIMFVERLDGTLQIITIDGVWIWDCVFEWGRFECEEGDYVIIIGESVDTELEIKYIFNVRFLRAILN